MYVVCGNVKEVTIYFKQEEIMKRYFWIAIIVCFLSTGFFGQAAAQENGVKIPQNILDKLELDRDEKIAFAAFFPFVPTGAPGGFPWETYLIVSNWSDANARVEVFATLSEQDPSWRQLNLNAYEQRIFRLNHLGITRGIANVLVMAVDAPIGAAAVMLNTRTDEFITALPPYALY